MRKKIDAKDTIEELLGNSMKGEPVTPAAEPAGTIERPAAASRQKNERKILTVRIPNDIYFAMKGYALDMQREGIKELSSVNAIVVKALQEYLAK